MGIISIEPDNKILKRIGTKRKRAANKLTPKAKEESEWQTQQK